MIVTCYSCHKKYSVNKPIGRLDECNYCSASTKVCINCLFYEPNIYNECREPQADLVKEKDIVNYCEYFRIKENNTYSKSTKNNKDLLNSIAKKLGIDEKPQIEKSAKEILEDLFKHKK